MLDLPVASGPRDLIPDPVVARRAIPPSVRPIDDRDYGAKLSEAALALRRLRSAPAMYQLGCATEASLLLREVLGIAADTGLLKTFADGGASVRTLLDELGCRATAHDSNVAVFDRIEVRWVKSPARMTVAQRRHGAGELSVRQRAVLELIGRGRSNKQIARDLNLAPETVKSYVKHIFVKLGTQTRAQAVACAARLGFI